jgi:predicted site-specific integrase-resolvase
MSRATLMRWTRDAGVKPVRKRGPHCYYKVTEVARMMGIDKEEIYERSLG